MLGHALEFDELIVWHGLARVGSVLDTSMISPRAGTSVQIVANVGKPN